VAVSLFSGAGGLDLGAEAAGYAVRAAVERDADSAATMETNFPHLASPVIRQDILDTPTAEILAAAGLGRREPPDLLIGGPNRRLRVAEVKRLFTFPDSFELVGSRSSAQSQLGNAVPPLLAEQVVRALDGGAPD
jgi:site-specific DNA-cytosine methylase